MRGGAAVRVWRSGELLGFRVYEPEALFRPGNPVAVVETRVEPLRGVWRSHLIEKHEGNLVFEDLSVIR